MQQNTGFAPERDKTDESLRVEREKADHELVRRRANIEERANAVVQDARDRADDVLEAARAVADEGNPATTPAREEALLAERERADDALRSERETADEILHAERHQQRSAREVLLRLEREDTDTRLLTERARTDEVVATREDFMAMASHDLRALLAGIDATTAVLARGAPADAGPASVHAQVARIGRFTARMNRLIGDLVDVASIEAGKLRIAPEIQEPVRVVKDSIEAFQASASASGMSLVSEILPGVTLARFDHERILQVLANLMSNAIKFSPKGARILLRVQPSGDEVLFSVSDSGSGIPEDKLEAVFQRFWQIGRNDRRGLGLGLYISRCIVEAHGGRIWAESSVGKGSSFQFTLPTRETAVVRTTPSAS
jgi:signal transduction histidine kinase